jgi:putative endonuclease
LRPGKRAERRAVWWYRVRGYRILATNAWAAGYELDIIVRRGRSLIFSEVKEKLGARFGDPLEMVDDEKQRRLRHAADAWLARHPEARGLRISFDVIAVRSGRLERVSEAF